MRAGYNGRVAISWKQTELDGLEVAPLAFLVVGAAWSWRGQALMLSDVAEQSLEQAGNAGSGVARTTEVFAVVRDITGDYGGSIVLTNGAQSFKADLIVVADEPAPTLVFENGYPPRDQDFWISELNQVEAQPDVQLRPTATVVAFPGQSRLS